MFDQSVLHPLLQVISARSQSGPMVERVLHEMKPVQPVLHPHVERRRERAFLAVSPGMKVPVCPVLGQMVD